MSLESSENLWTDIVKGLTPAKRHKDQEYEAKQGDSGPVFKR